MNTYQRKGVAFTVLGGNNWTGGISYLKNLLLSLHSLEDSKRPEIILLSSDGDTIDKSIVPLVDRQVTIPTHLSQGGLFGRIKKRVLSSENDLAAFLKQNGVDCVFTLGNFGSRFSLPLLSWIPDFQHLHLPEMYSAEDLASSTSFYTQNATLADRVILSSNDALGDFTRFAPSMAHKARILPFVAHLPLDVYSADPHWVCQQYHLAEKFIYLPNQFWKHKNHELVIRALEITKRSEPTLQIVCTGNTSDQRNPTFFSQLLTQISVKGVRDQFIILGMVPHAHIFSLMRQCVAVLQPSLFEGWSTTVEETKSIGKGIIISDIPVHREQNPPNAYFFDPHDPEALAQSLLEAFKKEKPGANAELESAGRKSLAERSEAFALKFLALINEVTSPQ